MRMIGSIPGDGRADPERFSDYLLAQDIGNMVEESTSPDANGAWLVWVEDDDKLERGKAELEAFLANPTDPKYDAARAAERIRKEAERQEKRGTERVVEVRTTWGASRQWSAPLTFILLGISIAIGLVTRVGDAPVPVGDALMFARPPSLDEQERALHQVFRRPGGLHHRSFGDFFNDLKAQGLADIASGQVWRLITPIFLHYGILHLVFNMFWLFDLGRLIETRRGTWRLAGLVLVAAVIPNFGQFLWDGPWFGGMSGVVYALFGYVWIKGKFEPQLGMQMRQETATLMLVWLGLGFTGLLGPIANAAHLLGLLVGVAAAHAPIGWRQLRRKLREGNA